MGAHGRTIISKNMQRDWGTVRGGSREEGRLWVTKQLKQKSQTGSLYESLMVLDFILKTRIFKQRSNIKNIYIYLFRSLILVTGELLI